MSHAGSSTQGRLPQELHTESVYGVGATLGCLSRDHRPLAPRPELAYVVGKRPRSVATGEGEPMDVHVARGCDWKRRPTWALGWVASLAACLALGCGEDGTMGSSSGRIDELSSVGESDAAAPSESQQDDVHEDDVHEDDVHEDDLRDAYCQMEATCIDGCLSGAGEIPCDSELRRQECVTDYQSWSLFEQSSECVSSLTAWIACVTSVSCDEVEQFFDAHPDGVTDDTPCAEAYRALRCLDFEPLTEYSFATR